MNAATDGLTPRQREILQLHEQGKSPTEIGQATGISSQAVHGHFRRLREKGLIPEGGPPRGAAARAPRRRNARRAIDASTVLDAVREAASQQRNAIDARKSEIAAEIEALKAKTASEIDTLKREDKELDKALTELNAMVGET